MTETCPRGIVPEKLDSSPSSILVAKLAERFIAPHAEVVSLLGTRVEVIEPSRRDCGSIFLGTVTEVRGQEVEFLPELETRYYSTGFVDEIQIKNPKIRKITANYTSTDPYRLSPMNDRMRYFKAILNYPPESIVIESDGITQLCFNIRDKKLDPFLKKALAVSPKITNFEDLAKLTNWIHHMIPYTGYVESDIFHRPSSLGDDLTKYGVVCRQLAGLAMGVLELNGIQVAPISGHSAGGNGHLYLAIDQGLIGQEERVICDPTWNLCESLSNASTVLKERNLATEFHSPANSKDTTLYPDWGFSQKGKW